MIDKKELLTLGEQIRNICGKGNESIESIETIETIETKAIVGMSEQGTLTGKELISPTIATPIFDGLKYTSKVWNRAKVYNVKNIPGNTFIQPYFNSSLEDEPVSGTRCYFVKDGDTKTECIPGTDKFVGILEKITCKITVTDEMLEDFERLADYLIAEATSKIAQKIDKSAFLGVGKSIKGVMGDGDHATVTVTTNSNVSASNVSSYVSALHPMAEQAEWYIAKTEESNIKNLSFNNDNALAFEDGKYWLFGYPVNILPALTATPYHIALADFSRFVIFHKDITIRKDPSLNFDTDQTTLLVEMRIAGGMAVKSSNLDDGLTYGWVVCPSGGEAGLESSSSSSSSSSEGNTSQSSESSRGYSSVSSESSSSSSEGNTSQSSESSRGYSSVSSESSSSGA